MSKLKYTLALITGLAIGGTGTYFSRNLVNQRSIDESYQAGKESGLIEGKKINQRLIDENYLAGKKLGLEEGWKVGYKEGQPQVDVTDVNNDGLTDLRIILSDGKQYMSIDYNNDGAQDVIITEKDANESEIYFGSGRCPLLETLEE